MSRALAREIQTACRHALLSLGLLAPMLASAAPPTVADPQFAQMLTGLLPGNVPTVAVALAATEKGVVFLDAREANEFAVSHLSGARNVGFDRFALSSVSDIDRQRPVIVYCSVGYRSELITARLIAAGFVNVRNLYGGLFEWVNEGEAVVDSDGELTERVHAYSPKWGVWLKRGDKVYN